MATIRAALEVAVATFVAPAAAVAVVVAPAIAAKKQKLHSDEVAQVAKLCSLNITI